MGTIFCIKKCTYDIRCHTYTFFYTFTATGIDLEVTKVILVFSDAGFCDFEIQDTPHGEYHWNETLVGRTDKQQCFYGSNSEGGMATRECGNHDMWMDYTSTDCITRVQHNLNNLVRHKLKDLYF